MSIVFQIKCGYESCFHPALALRNALKTFRVLKIHLLNSQQLHQTTKGIQQASLPVVTVNVNYKTSASVKIAENTQSLVISPNLPLAELNQAHQTQFSNNSTRKT